MKGELSIFVFSFLICCVTTQYSYQRSYTPRNTSFTNYIPPGYEDQRDYAASGPLRRTIDADEASMTVSQLIQKYDYPAEVYSVETKDGYILEMHRIPYGIESPKCKNKKRPVVLCFHDIISSSSDFIINGPDKSLGFLLADAGFDVWLGNARGNRYSRNHKTMSASNIQFWDFTFHEIGVNDLPAMIDFALNMTQQSQLFYVGFSQATTTYYVLMSERPDYNSKIKVAFHLSPVAYLTWMLSPILRFFSIFTNSISLFFDVIGVGEFLPNYDIVRQFGHLVCKGMDFTQLICTNTLFLLSGFNRDNLNMTRLPVYMGHTPAGSSTKQFMHYGQIVQSGVFKQFDQGILDNMAKWQSIKPPHYSLSKCTAPIVLFTSLNDWFSNPRDVDRLYRELPSGVARKIEIKDPRFTHVDFLFGLNAKEMIYDDLLEIIKQY